MKPVDKTKSQRLATVEYSRPSSNTLTRSQAWNKDVDEKHGYLAVPILPSSTSHKEKNSSFATNATTGAGNLVANELKETRSIVSSLYKNAPSDRDDYDADTMSDPTREFTPTPSISSFNNDFSLLTDNDPSSIERIGGASGASDDEEGNIEHRAAIEGRGDVDVMASINEDRQSSDINNNNNSMNNKASVVAGSVISRSYDDNHSDYVYSMPSTPSSLPSSQSPSVCSMRGVSLQLTDQREVNPLIYNKATLNHIHTLTQQQQLAQTQRQQTLKQMQSQLQAQSQDSPVASVMYDTETNEVEMESHLYGTHSHTHTHVDTHVNSDPLSRPTSTVPSQAHTPSHTHTPTPAPAPAPAPSPAPRFRLRSTVPTATVNNGNNSGHNSRINSASFLVKPSQVSKPVPKPTLPLSITKPKPTPSFPIPVSSEHSYINQFLSLFQSLSQLVDDQVVQYIHSVVTISSRQWVLLFPSYPIYNNSINEMNLAHKLVSDLIKKLNLHVDKKKLTNVAKQSRLAEEVAFGCKLVDKLCDMSGDMYSRLNSICKDAQEGLSIVNDNIGVNANNELKPSLTPIHVKSIYKLCQHDMHRFDFEISMHSNNIRNKKIKSLAAYRNEKMVLQKAASKSSSKLSSNNLSKGVYESVPEVGAYYLSDDDDDADDLLQTDHLMDGHEKGVRGLLAASLGTTTDQQQQQQQQQQQAVMQDGKEGVVPLLSTSLLTQYPLSYTDNLPTTQLFLQTTATITPTIILASQEYCRNLHNSATVGGFVRYALDADVADDRNMFSAVASTLLETMKNNQHHMRTQALNSPSPADVSTYLDNLNEEPEPSSPSTENKQSASPKPTLSSSATAALRASLMNRSEKKPARGIHRSDGSLDSDTDSEDECGGISNGGSVTNTDLVKQYVRVMQLRSGHVDDDDDDVHSDRYAKKDIDLGYDLHDIDLSTGKYGIKYVPQALKVESSLKRSSDNGVDRAVLLRKLGIVADSESKSKSKDLTQDERPGNSPLSPLSCSSDFWRSIDLTDETNCSNYIPGFLFQRGLSDWREGDIDVSMCALNTLAMGVEINMREREYQSVAEQVQQQQLNNSEDSAEETAALKLQLLQASLQKPLPMPLHTAFVTLDHLMAPIHHQSLPNTTWTGLRDRRHPTRLHSLQRFFTVKSFKQRVAEWMSPNNYQLWVLHAHMRRVCERATVCRALVSSYLSALMMEVLCLALTSMLSLTPTHQSSLARLHKLAAHFIRRGLPLIASLLSIEPTLFPQNVLLLSQNGINTGVHWTPMRQLVRELRVLNMLFKCSDVYVLPKIISAHTDAVRCIGRSTLSPHYVVTGGVDGAIRVFNTHTGQCVAQFIAHSSVVVWVELCQLDAMIISASMDGTVKIHDTKSCQLLYTLQHPAAIVSCHSCLNSRYLLTASMDCKVRLWSLHSYTCVAVLDAHTHWVTNAKFSAENDAIVTVGADRKVFIWSFKISATGGLSSSLLSTPPVAGPVLHSDYITHLLPLPRCRFASSSKDGSLIIWDAVSKTLDTTISVEASSPVSGLAISPNKQILAVARLDSSVTLYNAYNGILIRQLRVHCSAINTIAFTDNSEIALGTEDGKVIPISLK